MEKDKHSINSFFKTTYQKIYTSLFLKDYGFRPQYVLTGTLGRPLVKKVLCPEDRTWSTTHDFSHAAKNHCAATMLTNCILSQDILPQKAEAPKVMDPQFIFKNAHRFVGNGPVFRIEKNANRCFEENKTALCCRQISRRRFKTITGANDGFPIICREIDNGHYCGLLLCAGPFAWHWVLAAGYVVYPDGRKGILIEDNWQRQGLSVYFPDEVSKLKGIALFQPRS